jgi:hypothetical protein
MNRHGMVEPSAAGAQPPAMDLHASMAIADTDTVAKRRLPGRLRRAEAQRSGLSASIPAPRGGDHAIADISRRSKSP